MHHYPNRKFNLIANVDQEIGSVKHVAQETRKDWDKVKRDWDERFEKSEPEDGEDTD